MKVLYYHQHFSTPKGAAGTRSYEMAKALTKQGHDVTMVCGHYGGGKSGLTKEFHNGRRSGYVDDIFVIELNLAYSNNDGLLKRTWTFLNFSIKGILIALSHRYDLVFATTTPLTAGIPGIVAKLIRRKKFVFEVRDLWPELPKAMGIIKNPLILTAMSALEWLSYRTADRCIGLSPGIVEGIHSRGVKKENIAMIPNGCDLDLFNREVPAFRPDGVKESDFLAIFTGTHGMANGLHVLVEAAEELESMNRSDVKILLVGSGKLKDELIRSAERKKLSNILFHDAIPKEDLVGLMRSADLGLQILANIPAFYYGTSPNKFFDYISAGLPVLNNYPGWVAEMIKSSKSGVVVPPEDPTALARELESLSSKRDDLKVMGENAKKLALDNFDRRVLSNQWVKWLEGVFLD